MCKNTKFVGGWHTKHWKADTESIREKITAEDDSEKELNSKKILSFCF